MSQGTTGRSHPKLDYTGFYTPIPAQPSEAFPERTSRWLPLAEIGIGKPSGGGLRTFALMDTGSSLSLFPVPFAEALGLDWTAAPTCTITGISGTLIARVAQVRMILCGARYDWTTKVGFAPGFAIKVPILGHQGFFEHFEVRFKTGQRRFRIFLK